MRYVTNGENRQIMCVYGYPIILSRSRPVK